MFTGRSDYFILKVSTGSVSYGIIVDFTFCVHCTLVVTHGNYSNTFKLLPK